MTIDRENFSTKHFSLAIKQLLLGLCKSCLQGNQSVEMVIRIFADLQVKQRKISRGFFFNFLSRLGTRRCSNVDRRTSRRSFGDFRSTFVFSSSTNRFDISTFLLFFRHRIISNRRFD